MCKPIYSVERERDGVKAFPSRSLFDPTSSEVQEQENVTSVSVQYDNMVHLTFFSFFFWICQMCGQQFLAIQIILINSIIIFFW